MNPNKVPWQVDPNLWFECLCQDGVSFPGTLSFKDFEEAILRHNDTVPDAVVVSRSLDLQLLGSSMMRCVSNLKFQVKKREKEVK